MSDIMTLESASKSSPLWSLLSRFHADKIEFPNRRQLNNLSIVILFQLRHDKYNEISDTAVFRKRLYVEADSVNALVISRAIKYRHRKDYTFQHCNIAISKSRQSMLAPSSFNLRNRNRKNWYRKKSRNQYRKKFNTGTDFHR